MSEDRRVIIVSNRLPVTVKTEAGRASLVPSAGGLATALRAWHQHVGGSWVGWPGAVADPATLGPIVPVLSEQGLVPVVLSSEEAAGYYENFSNGVLWPLCHYLLDRVPVGEHDWRTYRTVNEKFADAVAGCYHPGDRIWVHDYHLMLLPRMLRQRLPDARIGFFHHVPFPSSEVFRILPWRAEILEGLLGADLIGFHTYGYVRHFAMAVLHILGIEPDVDRVRLDGHEVRLKAMPIGIDSAGFIDLASRPEVKADAEAIRREVGGRRILLAVDRLDYTKGLPRRLLAVERLLTDPEWRDRVKLIQIAVPTRERVESYRGFKRSVEQLVGRINGVFGTVESLPIHYLYGTVSVPRLVALYLAADVMLVTPLRDGLNLVAKEFVASRVDNDGVLVLSEFTGASTELGEAVMVNPYDVDALAAALANALRMPVAERAARMGALRTRVGANTADGWADAFMEALRAVRNVPRPQRRLTTPGQLRRDLGPLLDISPLALMLDYDGTLVPIAATPDLAAPDEALIRLLDRVARRAGTAMHVISGRPRDVLERWLGALPMTLWAEHGFWHRPVGAVEWTPASEVPQGWREKVTPILAHFTASTPGSSLEEKTASLTWHYRLADPEFGARQAHELRMLLGDALSNQPLEVREGKKVLEIRLSGAHKGLAVQRLLSSVDPPRALIALGDDATDEDLFAALPGAHAASVHVGHGPSRAGHWLADPAAAREWLALL